MAYTTIDNPELYFQVKTYSGNSSTQSITLDGSENMSPNLVWIKKRSDTSGHTLYDTIRGATKYLYSMNTDAQATATNGLTSFDSDGFALGALGDNNSSGHTFVSWNWKESATAGFDIVDYDGAGAANHSHSLSAVPKFMIVKRYNATESWFVYNGALGQAKVGYLNDSVAWGSGANVWGGSDPTSSVFSIGSDSGISGSGDYVAYLWAEKQGFSKFGVYKGSGSSTVGGFVYTGFKPAMVIMKNQGGSEDWHLYDNKRANSFNIADKTLDPNNTNAEYTIASGVDFLSNGFKWRATATALNGSADYVYGAWAEAPFVNSNGVPCTAR